MLSTEPDPTQEQIPESRATTDTSEGESEDADDGEWVRHLLAVLTY